MKSFRKILVLRVLAPFNSLSATMLFSGRYWELKFLDLLRKVENSLPPFIHPGIVATTVLSLIAAASYATRALLDPDLELAALLAVAELAILAIVALTPWIVPQPERRDYVIALNLVCFIAVLCLAKVRTRNHQVEGMALQLLVQPIAAAIVLCDLTAFLIAIRCGRRNAHGEYIGAKAESIVDKLKD
ncbi:hypothetical protein MKEN_01273300 [Mycena kentingensis (nom. inval.)]|nr:hypothetical protein MKEN_01273300 [Mycena kentingensis (nom. inval.)]